MAIIFSQGTEISSSGSSINVPGHIIKFSDYQATVSTTVTAGVWVNTMTNAITTSKNGNKILVEYMMNDRSDQGNASSWILHRILCNKSVK